MEISRYISDFFPQAEDTYGKCISRSCGKRTEMNSYEMLPLIQALSKQLNFTLKYDGWPRDEINFAALIDVKGNKRWREYVDKHVTRISYFSDVRSCLRLPKNQLFVHIRHTVGEPWMLEDTSDKEIPITERTPANKPECVRKWLEFAGIPHLDETLDSVGIQVEPADEDSESDSSSIDDS